MDGVSRSEQGGRSVGCGTQDRNPASDGHGAARRYRRDERIYFRQPGWGRIIAGAARQCVLRDDGRRQILDLLLPGDLFGVSAAGDSELSLEAAVDGTLVSCCSARETDRLADPCPCLTAGMCAAALDTIARLQRQLSTVGRITATEKVGGFLHEMAQRLGVEPDGSILLPVSRTDIADYLSISVETVSRSLTSLERRGLIRVTSARHIRILDSLTVCAASRSH